MQVVVVFVKSQQKCTTSAQPINHYSQYIIIKIIQCFRTSSKAGI